MGHPFETMPGRSRSNLLFICDHASNRIPALYSGLGMPADAFTRHIAYDVGAAELTRKLAQLFEAPAVLSRFSRLLIDPNRGLDDPTLVMRLSDGAIIPGNARIGADEVEKRVERYWRPYRSAVAGEIANIRALGGVPVIISIHSFTPVWKGLARPWDLAVLWDNDPRLALPLIASLRAANITVGDNEPYDGALVGDTLYDLATTKGLPHVLIEVRQDHLASPGGVEDFANKLATALKPLHVRAEMHVVREYGSRTDPNPKESMS